MKYYYYYNFEGFTEICLADNGTALTDLIFNGKAKPDWVEKETDIIKLAKNELDEFFAGKRKEFSVPLSPFGTEFQLKVWNALLTIPYGKTASYKDIAIKIGNPKACRAVGMANNRNPLAIFIPCHRIIGANGKLVGYGGGLSLKEKLLDIENKF